MNLNFLGKRDSNSISLFEPHEVNDYKCPYCKELSLTWSEYKSCLWCLSCKWDIPSCLCIEDTDKAMLVFLSTLKEFKEKVLAEQHLETTILGDK